MSETDIIDEMFGIGEEAVEEKPKEKPKGEKKAEKKPEKKVSRFDVLEEQMGEIKKIVDDIQGGLLKLEEVEPPEEDKKPKGEEEEEDEKE